MNFLLRHYALLVFIFLPAMLWAQTPDANFTATPVQGCSPLSVQFTSTMTNDAGYTHSWNFGNGPGTINNAPKNPSATYTTPGTYTVTHTVTGPGGTATVTKNGYITVHQSPTVDFGASATSICPGMSVLFTDNSNLGVSGTGTYDWVFGGNATPNLGSGKTVNVTYATAGKYNVTLKVTNAKGCNNSVTKTQYINVLEKPIVNFTADKADFCSAPATVKFTASITGSSPGPYTYLWEFGGPGNPTSTDTAPSFTYNGPAPAQYTVKLTIRSANGCTETLTRTDYIKLHKPQASFTGPATVCPFVQANFINTSSPTGASYKWNYGDGTPIETTTNGAHIYASSGTYPVRLIVSIGGCNDTFTKQIFVFQRPNYQVKLTPDSVCPAPQTICFSTDTALASYKWYFDHFGGTTTYTSPTPCHTYYQNGQYSLYIESVDKYGCKDTNTWPFRVKIFPLYIRAKVGVFDAPNPPIYADSGCVPFPVNFNVNIFRDSDYVYPYGVKRYKWDFGDGDTANTKAPVHVYKDSGNFRVIVDVYTNNGCKISDTTFVKAGYKPIIDSMYALDTIICRNSTVFFRSRVRGYDTLIWHWDFEEWATKVPRDSVVSHYFIGGPPCDDSMTIKLVVSHKGCRSDSVIRKNYIAKKPPCADFDRKLNSCTNRLKVQFLNKSIGDSSRVWKFGDGNTSTLNNPEHTYAAPGKYNVWLVVYNSTTLCYDSFHRLIYVGENKPDFFADKRKLCITDSVLLTAYLTGDTSSAIFDWYIDNVKVAANRNNFYHKFQSGGYHSVKIIGLNNTTGCIDTVTKTDWITVGDPAAYFYTSTTKVCFPANVAFADTSKAPAGTSIVSRFWNFGTSAADTLTTTNTSVSRPYTSVGDYGVTLIIKDDIGCYDTLLKPAYIHVHKPVAAFTGQTPVCVGGEAIFTNASTNAVKFRWTFGDGGVDTVNADARHTYTARGTYNVRLIVTDTVGCMDTTANFVVTAVQPTANFTLSDSMAVCAPLIVRFDGTSSIAATKYTWYFDDGSSPGSKSVHTVVYNSLKEYNVKLIVTDVNGCKDSITKTVQVLGYAGAFNYTTPSGCAPLTVNFSLNIKGNVPTIIWDFGDGNTLLGSYTQPNISYTYKTPGRYLPRVIFNNNQGCSVGSEGLDTVLVDGSVADFETGPACENSLVQFINKSKSEVTSIVSTLWTFHDGSFSALSDPKRKYGPAGKYKVKLFVNNAQGCKDSIEKEITVNVPMEINAGADSIICLKDSAMLQPSGGVSYIWSPGTTLSCTGCTNPFAFPKVKTEYTVVGTDVNGCNDTDKVIVDIKTHVTSTAGKGGEICEGEAITLSVSGAQRYLWSPAELLDNSSSATPAASPKVDTRFLVIAYEGSCIPDSNNVDVVVHPKPTVSVRGEQTIVAGQSADLLASGDNIVKFLWSPAQTLSCENCSSPAASPYKTTTYKVKVFTKFDCVDSANVTVTVLCDEKQLFIPNTFTPNGDGVNDIFMVRGDGISTLQSFRIYDRWGKLLFERKNVSVNDKQYGWDGTLNGEKLPPDVYVYTVEAYCENGDLLKLKGDVTIIR